MAGNKPRQRGGDWFAARRLGLGRGDAFGEAYTSVLPTYNLGTDYFDQERPLWHSSLNSPIDALGNPLSVARYPTVSLSSRYDLAIYGVEAQVVRLSDLVYTFSGLSATVDPAGSPVYNTRLGLLNPPSTWIPFEFDIVFSGPGIRPRTQYDGGGTLTISGTATIPPPFLGNEKVQPGIWWPGQYFFPNVGPVPWPAFWCGGASPVRWIFDRPLILPATMFLTCVAVTNTTDFNFLETNWIYSELEGVE